MRPVGVWPTRSSNSASAAEDRRSAGRGRGGCAGVLCCPRKHWPKIRSTNPLERFNREIGRTQSVAYVEEPWGSGERFTAEASARLSRLSRLSRRASLADGRRMTRASQSRLLARASLGNTPTRPTAMARATPDAEAPDASTNPRRNQKVFANLDCGEAVVYTPKPKKRPRTRVTPVRLSDATCLRWSGRDQPDRRRDGERASDHGHQRRDRLRRAIREPAPGLGLIADARDVFKLEEPKQGERS
jgi:hypothetical protein